MVVALALGFLPSSPLPLACGGGRSVSTSLSPPVALGSIAVPQPTLVLAGEKQPSVVSLRAGLSSAWLAVLVRGCGSREWGWSAVLRSAVLRLHPPPPSLSCGISLSSSSLL